ncbi:MAG: hypothetical protein ACRDL3_03900 [Solirubrobacterales bacterium]
MELAAVKLDHGREVELRSSLPPNAAPDFPPCLKVVGIDEQTRACGRPPSEVEPPITGPVVAQAVAQSGKQAALEVYGATGADVAEVRVIYTVGGSSKRVSATLLQVADEEVLSQARISEPFTYFLAELPAQASDVRAIALDVAGEQRGSDDFDRYMGEARRQAFIEVRIRDPALRPVTRKR